MQQEAEREARVEQLHRGGVIDLHFDLPLGLYLQRARRGIIAHDFLPQFAAGGIHLLGVALFLEDKHLGQALPVALAQIALLLDEIADTPQLALCRTWTEIEQARAAGRVALLLTMEGAEPLGEDLHLLRVFHALGLRALSLTHARRNAAAAGGIFAASGSPACGLTAFGRELVRECQRLGILLDLAHINPAGFEEICALTSGPVIVSHSNARRFHDLERNLSDAQIRAIGARGGVIGVNAILVAREESEATLDRYIDHIEHIAELIGIDGVGLGFDFCEFLWRLLPEEERTAMEQS